MKDVKRELRSSTVLNLEYWDRPGRFYGCASETLPKWYVSWARTIDLTPRQRAIVEAQKGLCTLAVDQREGH